MPRVTQQEVAERLARLLGASVAHGPEVQEFVRKLSIRRQPEPATIRVGPVPFAARLFDQPMVEISYSFEWESVLVMIRHQRIVRGKPVDYIGGEPVGLDMELTPEGIDELTLLLGGAIGRSLHTLVREQLRESRRR